MNDVLAGSEGESLSAPRGGLWSSLRNARIGVKLTLIAAAGLVAAGSVGVAGLQGLGSVQDRAQELARISATLKTVAELRDAEGDMRVTVHELAAADTDKAFEQSVADAQDSDARVDAAVGSLRAALTSDPAALADLDQFVTRLQAWRTLRDEKLQPVAHRHDLAGAVKIISGPLSAADDAYATPFDDLVERVTGQVSPAAAAATTAYSHSRLIMTLALLLGAILAAVLAVMIGRMIVRPLADVRLVLERLAHGDLTRTPDITSRDEVGQMARALGAAVTSLRTTMQQVAGKAELVAASVQRLSGTNARIADSAEQSSAQAGLVAAAAKQVSQNVSTVAAGAEEMGASIREIAQSVTEATGVAADAVRSADAANATIGKLEDSSSQIAVIVQAITSIAEQTNLLALNATIEAARAGEAGKGFAVVAQEVKELAQETARATQDIGHRVESIQTGTADAIGAISQVASIIHAISDHTGTIAAAVEEQTATTGEIARTVAEAATGSGHIAENITTVATTAAAATADAAESHTATGELAQLASELHAVVAHFTC